MSQLEVLRSKIEKTTLQMLTLLNERGRIAQEIGKLKEMQGTNVLILYKKENYLIYLLIITKAHLTLQLFSMFLNKFSSELRAARR